MMETVIFHALTAMLLKI